jgi:hypothetical protein
MASPLLFAIAACGSGAGSTFDGGADASSGGDAGPDVSGLQLEGGNGGEGAAGDGASCGTDRVTAKASPAYLVFIMDHSDSMSQDSKWKSCSAALESFFSAKTSVALSASLTWLPYNSGTVKHPVASCTSSDYEAPAVPMTLLPASSFGTAIAAEALEEGTPTLAALEGSVAYAATVQKAHPGAKVLIVLATDGIPAGCTGNTVATVAAEAASTLSTNGILTYVIGVGTETKNLDQIAAGGGTKTAFIVPTGDDAGAATTAAFEAAIATIQGTLGCDYPIPDPLGGEKIDYTKVNVELTSSDGTVTDFTYSADCSNTNGWHYDHPASPSVVVLCSGACTAASSTTGESLDIVFGCKSNGFVP